jgi:HPt (histidine-containing phosphotransfer) domain-containing protein
MANLRDGLARGDAEQVRTSAHGLKGALGSLGADAAADLSKQLQNMASDGDLTRVPDLLQEMEARVESFVSLAGEYGKPDGSGETQV